MKRRTFLTAAATLPLVAGFPFSRSSATEFPEVDAKIQDAWDVSWRRFYLPKTHVFYDFLTAYDDAEVALAHLPSVEEVAARTPNLCGYGTGMEDGMIFAGTWMTLLVDRAEVETKRGVAQETRDLLRTCARDVFQGIYDCATIHGEPGFLARALCPEDGKSVYPTTSRDQYTHAVHGMWCYYHSPLCDAQTREKVREVAGWIADRMIRNVIPENDFDSLQLDGKRDERGISRMWNVRAHEAARLPMIYAVAWDTCRESENAAIRDKAATYEREYRKYLGPAVEQTLALTDDVFRRWMPTYALLQMQSSMELLYALEPDAGWKSRILDALKMGHRRAVERLNNADVTGRNLDFTYLFRDWREDGGGIPWATPVRTIWYNPREIGEAAMTQLMVPNELLSDDQFAKLRTSILRIDYQHVATSGIFYLQAAWWRHLARSLADTIG